ncbi:unnamed protein product [Lymnaea stagnalis]|uniref:Uncharacterized protein n=1 Tax=Lymnaea stagnalis TaxID=6523 RepID=A0AAV2I0W1_LYMST
MNNLLTSSFVEHHITQFPGTLIPEEWGLVTYSVYYQLDLKMCQLKSLDYSFNWGDEKMPVPRVASVLEMPSKIIKFDVSLNELTSLSHDALVPFRNLRSLDASLNQLRHFQGIEVLEHLYTLNLSHNMIKRVDALLNSHSLRELNVSNNHIEDISGIPSLINLLVLNLNYNKLKSLEGVTSFPKLEELLADNNELKDLIPLISCRRIRVISAANNQIQSVDSLLRLISQHKSLQSLNLTGNPVEREHTYQSDILREAKNIVTLDNISVKPMPTVLDDHKRHANNLYTLQDAARQAFEDRIRVARQRMEENVNFLQRRILSIQQEYSDFEKKMKSDLEACLRFLSTLGDVELSTVGRDPIGASFNSLTFQYPYVFQDQHRHRRRDPKSDYSDIKETDEVLRNAFKELVKEKEKYSDL